MNRFLLNSTASLIAACAVIVAPAAADELDLDYEGISGGGIGVEVTIGSQRLTQQVGRSDWTVRDGGSGYGGGSPLHTFAIQYTGGTAEGMYQQEALASDGHGMSASEVMVVAELFERHFVDAVTFSTPASDDDLVEAAAFQMVLWEIAYESHDDDAFSVASSLDLSGGDMSFREGQFGEHTALFADALAMAESWISELAQTTEFDSEYMQHLFGLRMGDRAGMRNYLTATPIMVPLPAPVWFASLGIVAVVVARRRVF